MNSTEILFSKAKDKNYTLGHLFLDCMKMKPKEFLCQIDAATGKSETNESVLSRSIRMAKCLRRLGLKAGDVLALGGRNHLDLHIPYYAAILNGLPIVGVDPYFKFDEIKHLFKLTEPKIAFCQSETLELYERAARELNFDLKVVTFDGDDCTFSKLLDTCPESEEDEDFQVAEFDPDTVYGWLVSTSGTTGMPKVAAFQHHTIVQQLLFYVAIAKYNPDTLNLAMNLAPVQWISGFFHALGMPLLNLCKLQTSAPDDTAHVIDMINEYKPVTMTTSPATMAAILHHEKPCDLSCFKNLTLTGAKVYERLILDVKGRLSPDCVLMEAYGQTESLGPSLAPNVSGPPDACGRPLPPSVRLVKLVDPETGLEVTEPHVPGELWIKGGPCFTEYYKNPEETAKMFSEDGWLKSGDLLYRDENNYYYFIERIKMLIKYKNYHINPLELEEVISSLEGVAAVCVVGIPHPTDGQLAAACVVRRPRCDVTAHEVKDIVATRLSASKRLRGGVVFVPRLPMTSSGKVARAQLTRLAIDSIRE